MKLYSYNRRRIYIVFICILIAGIILSGRLVYLMIYKSEHYSMLADSLHERERSIKAPRGRIYDRNGNVLADNKAVCSISVIHSQITDTDEVAEPNAFAITAAVAAFTKGQHWLDELCKYLWDNRQYAEQFIKQDYC